jgi:hypothetical protein
VATYRLLLIESPNIAEVVMEDLETRFWRETSKPTVILNAQAQIQLI